MLKFSHITWRQIGDRLGKTLDELRRDAGPKPPDTRLLNMHSETRKAVIDAVKIFESNGDWPKLSRMQIIAICTRLEFACRLIKLLHGPKVEEATWPIAAPCGNRPIIEWLLIDAYDLYELPKHITDAAANLN